MQYEYQKSQNLMLISNPLKKLQKTHVKKLAINSDKNRDFDFYYCEQFLAYNFFWVIFALF
jgi:hypothetical protein